MLAIEGVLGFFRLLRRYLSVSLNAKFGKVLGDYMIKEF